MPNDPYLDASVRWKIRTGQAPLREARYSEVRQEILDSGLATAVIRAIGSGKEAEVSLCEDGNRLVAVKAYRMFRTSNHFSREMRIDTAGHMASREFELLGYAWQDGAPVPRPLARVENMFSMEFLGSADRPAPRLQEVEPTALGELAPKVARAVIRLASAGVIHSDLSPFNILVDRGEPWLIDLGSCLRVDRLGSPPWVRLQEVRKAVTRGTRSLESFFRRRGVPFDAEGLGRSLLEEVQRFSPIALDG